MKTKIKARKITAAICVLLSVFMSAVHAEERTAVGITINGEAVALPSAAFISEDRTLVPIRAFCGAMGAAEPEWNSTDKSVTIRENGCEAVIFIGSADALVNGEPVSMGAAAEIYADRTYLPLRFAAELLGAETQWLETTRTAAVTKDSHTVPPEYISTDYTDDDLEWLAKIVHAEAEGESLDGKIAVANVVLNRVRHTDFPSTIYDVIFDRQYSVQFTPVANGTIYNEPSAESYYAARQALSGVSRAGESLYFCNPTTSVSTWIMNNRSHYTTIGGHAFYL